MREKTLISVWIIPVSMDILVLRCASQSGSSSSLQVLIQHQRECLSRQLVGLHSPTLDVYQLRSGVELFTYRAPFIGLSLNIGLSTYIF